MDIIKKSGLAVIEGNRLLLVRKKGSPCLLMPGGKPKEGESAIDALKREIMEELCCSIDESSIKFLGTFEDVAVDKAARVSIGLYAGKLIGTPKPSSEIGQLVWISAAEAASNPQTSPIVRNRIVPFLVSKRML